MEAVLNDRDALYVEKQRCLRAMGVADDKTKLDDVIGKLTGLSITSNMGVEKKDEIISRLEERVLTLDREAEDNDRTLELLRRQHAEKEIELSSLRRGVHID